MEETFEIYAMDNEVEEFYRLRPELNEYQFQLLEAYYKARRNTQSDKKVTSEDLEKYLQAVNYETDLGVIVLQKLDDHYSARVAEKMRRALKK